MDDHMVPVRVQQVGERRHSRYLLRDGIGQFWTGSGWADEPSEAALYYRPADAVEARDRFYLEGGQPEEVFTATVVVRAVKGDWTATDLAEHLKQWGKFLMRPSGEQRGVVVEIAWGGLTKET
jgi:hypothetical protein